MDPIRADLERRFAALDERTRWYVMRQAASLSRVLIESGCELSQIDADERGLRFGLDMADRGPLGLGRRMAEIEMDRADRMVDRDLATDDYSEWPILTIARSRYRNGEGE